MHVRCSYCSQTFNLGRDFMVQALERAERKGHKYVAVDCINCRKQIKVPAQLMRTNVPAVEEADEQSD